VKREWEEFRIAGAFLTVFPLARNLEMEPERLARSMGFFPAVGLAMGLGLVVLDWFLAPLIPRAVLDCLLILMLIAATGALPLDGIANLIDGLTGGKDPKEVLRIMKDSRVGAMGVAGLVMVLLLKYLSLYNIPLPMKSNALIFMPASGLWVQVALAFCCRCVPTEGETGGDFVNNCHFVVGRSGAVRLEGTSVPFASWLGRHGFNALFRNPLGRGDRGCVGRGR